MPHATHPALVNKVVNLADIRAQRLAAQVTDQIIEEQDAGAIGTEMTDTEKVWWRNNQFFAERMARDGGYGRVAFEVGRLEGDELVMRFECDAYEAFYSLDDRLIIDWAVDPLLVRWSVPQEPPFPVLAKPNFTPEVK